MQSITTYINNCFSPQVRGWRAAAADLPAVPHLRQVHQICLHPGPGLLRQYSYDKHGSQTFYSPMFSGSPCRIQKQISPGGEGVWQRRRWVTVSSASVISHDRHLSEGSQSNISGGTEGERGPAAMARAVTVHQDTMKVMYFAWAAWRPGDRIEINV